MGLDRRPPDLKPSKGASGRAAALPNGVGKSSGFIVSFYDMIRHMSLEFPDGEAVGGRCCVLRTRQLVLEQPSEVTQFFLGCAVLEEMLPSEGRLI